MFLRKYSVVIGGEHRLRLERGEESSMAREAAMSRRSVVGEIRLPNHDEPVSAVTILDGQGRVMRIVPANEFRRGPVGRRHHGTRAGVVRAVHGNRQGYALDKGRWL